MVRAQVRHRGPAWGWAGFWGVEPAAHKHLRLQDQARTAGNRRDGHLGPDVERIKQVLRDDLDVSDGELSDVTFLKTGVGESAASDEMRFDALEGGGQGCFRADVHSSFAGRALVCAP